MTTAPARPQSSSKSSPPALAEGEQHVALVTLEWLRIVRDFGCFRSNPEDIMVNNLLIRGWCLLQDEETHVTVVITEKKDIVVCDATHMIAMTKAEVNLICQGTSTDPRRIDYLRILASIVGNRRLHATLLGWPNRHCW